MLDVPSDPLQLVDPAYGQASLADVMPGVLAGLGVAAASDPLGLATQLDGVRRVVLLQVDGLGYYQLAPAATVAPVLADVVAGRLGQLRPITAAFPSTTPTGLTTLGTGVSPGTHGVVGFRVRMPGSDQVLTHIRWRDDPQPERWQPVPTGFERAAAAGVTVRVVARPEYDGSGLTRSAWRGGRYMPADDADQLATELLAALADDPAPSLVYGYLPDLDAVGHWYGLESPEWRQAAVLTDRLIERLVAGLPADAALLVTADHGQLDIPQQTRLDLASEPELRAGVRVIAGEARVRYLHPEPGATEDVLAAWRGRLGQAAWVGTREEAVAAGWFGPVTPAHLPRIGEVVVVCRGRYAVMSTGTEPARDAQLVAYHGALTAVEMLVPLLLVRS